MCTLFIQWRNVWLRKNILLLIKFIRKCTAKCLSIVLFAGFCVCMWFFFIVITFACICGIYLFTCFSVYLSSDDAVSMCSRTVWVCVSLSVFKKRNCMQFTITGNGIYNFLSHFFARIAVDFYNSHTNKKASDFAICSKHLHTFIYAVDVYFIYTLVQCVMVTQ